MYFDGDPGGGPPNTEILGENGEYITREWFAPVEDTTDTTTITWLEVLSHWDVLEADLHHFFGIDLGSDIVRQRDWRWFTVRVGWLFGVDSGLNRALRPPEPVDDTPAHDA